MLHSTILKVNIFDIKHILFSVIPGKILLNSLKNFREALKNEIFMFKSYTKKYNVEL